MSGPLADLDAEASVVCALVVWPHRFPEVVDVLTHEHFFDDAHGYVFRAALKLWRQGAPVDAISIARLLKEKNLLEAVGGTPKIFVILDAPVIADIRHHALAIIEFARRRKLRDLIAEVEAELISGQLSADDAIARLAEAAP